MHALTVFLIVASALVAHALPPRIIGGNDAPIGKYPYQVSLRYLGKHFCGGSIISERYVLTAAHCIVSLRTLNFVTVHAGTNYLNETGDSYGVEKIIYHERYSGFFLVNDIGVLRLKEDIKFTDLVQPIKLADSDSETDGISCVVSGWGSTELNGSAPNSLQELYLLVEPQDRCLKVHWRIKDSHICTFTEHGQGLCHGDSGGPLVADGVQIGIVSFGRPCAIGYPDVFTRVAYFKDWLKQHVQDA